MRITDRIMADFAANELIIEVSPDQFSKMKVEPRIMQVLQILLREQGRVVSREQLIDEVWHNYGGANEALNQSISHLRKVLNDTDRHNRLIETVVKKGYRFTGQVNTELPPKKLSSTVSQPIGRQWIIRGLALLLAITGIYVLNNYGSGREADAPLAPPVSEEGASVDTTYAPPVDR